MQRRPCVILGASADAVHCPTDPRQFRSADLSRSQRLTGLIPSTARSSDASGLTERAPVGWFGNLTRGAGDIAFRQAAVLETNVALRGNVRWSRSVRGEEGEQTSPELVGKRCG